MFNCQYDNCTEKINIKKICNKVLNAFRHEAILSPFSDCSNLAVLKASMESLKSGFNSREAVKSAIA